MSRPIPEQIKKSKKTNISEMVDMDFILDAVERSFHHTEDVEENEENERDE